jgi:putative inorganic carbon (hco3(-)) transporter
MIASSSRGALLGGGAVILFMLIRSKYKVRALLAAAVVSAVFVFAIPPQQRQRLSASGEDETSLSRLTYWKHGIEMTNDHPILGVGYNNWIAYYQDHYSYVDPNRKEVAHNIFVQAASELGYAGLAAFLLLVLCTFVLNSRSRTLATRAGPAGRWMYYLANGLDGALIGFLVSGFFISALYYPFLWINLAMTVALNTVAGRLPESARAPMRSRNIDRRVVASGTDDPLQVAGVRTAR